MAYNSDGYIMIDFTEVDFRRTNQTIEGLYKRCVDVIGTNKFILVINANGRTPLPATCSFTNNQYVIDTCIYMFAISSNDNLFIRRNDVPASDIIDDSSISVDKTWSSNKIDTELDGKADVASLADYQPLLTAVSPVSINADNEISVDLSGKQNVLTAGDNITISNDVISSNPIKSFTYTGNGSYINNIINFPTKPNIILKIWGMETVDNEFFSGSFTPDEYGSIVYNLKTSNITNYRFYITKLSDTSIRIDNPSGSAFWSLNTSGVEYTVLYI